MGPVRFAFVVTFPAVRDDAVPVRPVPAPENDVDVSAPVEGLKLNFVEEIFCGRLPVVVVTHVGYIVAFVLVSSVIAVFVAFVAVVAVVADVADVAVAAAIEVLQLKPVPLVHNKALLEVLHEGTLCPVGATAVKDPKSWLALNAPVSVPAVVAVAALPPIERFETTVVDVTVSGAVPVATVETSVFAVMLPETTGDVT